MAAGARQPGPLPSDALLLHVGPPKTGSTSLQSALAECRDELPRHGVAYPGRGLRWTEATRYVVGERRLAGGPSGAGAESWAELVGVAAEHREVRVCVSNEIFARADDEVARRVVRDLGLARVHVVLVARELGRLLISQWQERVKQRQRTGDLDEWLREVLDPEDDGHEHRHFWRQQDLGGLVARWAEAAEGRVTVVVGDHRDKGTVVRSFEQLLGLPPGMLESGPRNPALTHGRVQLLREVDGLARERGWNGYHRGLRVDLVKTLVSHPAENWETHFRLPDWALGRVREESERHVAQLRSSGVRVVGPLDALLLPPETGEEPQADVRFPVGLARELVDLCRRDVEPFRARPGRGRKRRAPSPGQAPPSRRGPG